MVTKNMLILLKKVLFFVFLVSSFHSKATPINGTELNELVENWLIEQGQIANVKILDQIKYPFCDEEGFLINDISGSFKLIKVSCTSPNNWSFIVRNKINKKSAFKKSIKKERIKSEIYVFVLKNSKSKNSIILKDDLTKIKKIINNQDGLIDDIEDIVGHKLKKSVSANKPLYFSNLKKNWMIEKDSKVIIENRIKNIVIKDEGIALENADNGSKIRVKNIKSGKILVGYAENSKKVLLNAKQN